MTARIPQTVRWGNRVRDLERRLENARADRDAAIRAAHASGAGPTQLAREVGLTRQAIYKIVTQLDTSTELT